MTKRTFLLALTFGVSGLNVLPANAALETWDGGAATGNWGDAANWNLDGVPTNAVDDVTIISPGVPISIGGTRDLNGRTAIFTDATFTSDAINFDNYQGVFNVTDVTFNTGVSILKVPNSTTFTNSNFNDSSNNWLMGAVTTASLQINGGMIRAGNVEMKPASSGITVTMTVDGSAVTNVYTANPAHHFFNEVRVGFEGSGDTSFTVKNIVAANYVNTARQRWGQSTGTTTATVNLEDSTVLVEGTIDINATADLNAKNATVQVQAGFIRQVNNNLTSVSRFDGEGLSFWTINDGDIVAYEVAGTDTGATFAAFHDNYSIDSLTGALKSGTNSRVDLIDNVDNNGGALDSQALYVDKISLDTTLDATGYNITTNGRKVYYKKLNLNGETLKIDGVTFSPANPGNTPNLVQVNGTALMSKTPFVHTPDAQTLVDQSNAMVTVNSDYGTIILTGSAPGDPVRILLDVTGSPGDVAALAADLGATTSGFSAFVPAPLAGESWDMMLTYNGVADGNPLFFDWSTSYRNVVVNDITTAVPEPASGLALAVGGLLIVRRRRA